MAFRTSTLPSWNAKENNAYFPTAKPVSEPSTTTGAKSASLPTNRYAYRKAHAIPGARCLSADNKTAYKKLRDSRLRKAGISVSLCHIIVFLVLFTLFPLDRGDAPDKAASRPFWIFRVCKDFKDGLASFMGLAYAISIACKMLLIGNVFVHPDKYCTSYLEELKRLTSLKFLVKNLMLILLVNIDYIFLLGLFDRSYAVLFNYDEFKDSKMLQSNCSYKEECIVVQLSVTVSALFLFYKNYVNSKFTFDFLPVQPGRQTNFFSLQRLFDLKDILVNSQCSILPAIFVATISFFLGPLIFYPVFYPFGVNSCDQRLMDRIFLYLSIGFIFRLFVYSFLVMFLLSLLAYCIHNSLIDPVDFHIEQPAKHDNCMIMSNAMKGESKYLRTLAFREYNARASTTNPDIYVFFYVTHPGNHPLTWRNVMGASVETIKVINVKLVKFLHSSQHSSEILQPFMPGHILKSYKEPEPEPKVKRPSEVIRNGNMRDLASMQEPARPTETPTITDLLWQNLEQFLNDVSTSFKSLVTVQLVRNLNLSLNLGTQIEEKIIANIIEVDHTLVYWAIMGSVKLMCISVDIDERGVVSPDVKPFMVTLLETHDVYTTMDTYMSRYLDDENKMYKGLLDRNREIVTCIINTCSFAVAKLHHTYSKCYSILGIDEDLEKNILDVINSRDRF